MATAQAHEHSLTKAHPMTPTQTHAARQLLGALALLIGMTGQLASAASLTLTGDQEVPPVITSGDGTGELLVATDGTLSGSITTHGVDGTMAHVHRGAKGVNGPVVITLKRGEGGVWTVPPATRLTDDQLAAYRAGELYVNVHTVANKGGEIRTQLAP
jgi:hypothetical protein